MPSTATRISGQNGRAHATRASRGSLSDLGTLLSALVDGRVYDTYAGNPNGNLTPAAAGAWCLDSTNSVWYRATGTTDTSWRMIPPGLDQASYFFDDFLAAGIDAKFSSTAGSGTGNEVATTVAGAVNGHITLKSASDDGAHGANGTALTLDQLNYKANQGGLAMGARLKISDVSEAALFVGFTDTISTTVELPIFLATTNIDSDATDAAGVGYDVDGTTKQFFHGGVKNGTDTTPAYSGTAPLDDTFFTVEVQVSAAGAVQGYVDGQPIGTAVADAVTATVALTPAIVIANRSANQVTATIDYFWVRQNR